MNTELLTINNDFIHLPIIEFIIHNKFIKKDFFHNIFDKTKMSLNYF